MSVLSDVSIRELGENLIDPFYSDRVQPASYDLTLGDELLVPLSDWPRGAPRSWIDIRENNPKDFLQRLSLKMWAGGSGYTLKPGGCMLACTAERITVPHDLVARVEGKSSIGRLFLAIHCTAGWLIRDGSARSRSRSRTTARGRSFSSRG